MINNPLLLNKTVLKSDCLDERILNLIDKTFVVPASFSFNLITITSDFIGRMDLISKQIYGDPDYADILCKLNGISNPFELNEDAEIVVPILDDISQFYYKEKAAELDETSDAQSNVPKAKNKTEKRKPNEAVIGDKRYKIDSTRKVIIY